jgi:hypothetical protein
VQILKRFQTDLKLDPQVLPSETLFNLKKLLLQDLPNINLSETEIFIRASGKPAHLRCVSKSFTFTYFDWILLLLNKRFLDSM